MDPLVVYSNNTCPNCDNLKRALGIKNIPFKEVNISDRPEEGTMIRERGFRSLPVINNAGEWLNGFTQSNFMKIVASHQAAV